MITLEESMPAPADSPGPTVPPWFASFLTTHRKEYLDSFVARMIEASPSLRFVPRPLITRRAAAIYDLSVTGHRTGDYLPYFTALESTLRNIQRFGIGASTLLSSVHASREAQRDVLRKHVADPQVLVEGIDIVYRSHDDTISFIHELAHRGVVDRTDRPTAPGTGGLTHVPAAIRDGSAVVSCRTSSLPLEWFRTLAVEGAAVLLITRDRPDRARKAAGIELLPTIWLTTNQTTDEFCVPPTAISRLTGTIVEYVEQCPGATILLDGLDYLVTHNDFPIILRLVHYLADKVLNAKGVLITVVPEHVFAKTDEAAFLRDAPLLEGGQHGARG